MAALPGESKAVTSPGGYLGDALRYTSRGVTLLMWFVAAGSFSTVDRVLRAPSPPLSEAAERIGHERTRMALRYLASEINRNCFNVYGWGQVALGSLLLVLLSRQIPRDKAALVIAGVMLGLVLLMTLVITPAIVALGRSIDFLPRNPPPAEMPRFRMLHMAFTGLDGTKFLAGLALLIRWVLAR